MFQTTAFATTALDAAKAATFEGLTSHLLGTLFDRAMGPAPAEVNTANFFKEFLRFAAQLGLNSLTFLEVSRLQAGWRTTVPISNLASGGGVVMIMGLHQSQPEMILRWNRISDFLEARLYAMLGSAVEAAEGPFANANRSLSKKDAAAAGATGKVHV